MLEPLSTTVAQSLGWSAGYVVLLLLVLATAAKLPAQAASRSEPVASVEWRRWLGWVVLAAVPSGLMLSTSTHLTTDLVAMPLLWVVPLGLYLLSFSLAFSDAPAKSRIARAAAPLLVLGAGLTFVMNAGLTTLAAIAGLALLFAVAVALHAELHRRRPEPGQLTAFYLAMSVGGVLGGLFCALAAPLLFDWVWEHPILLLAAAALLPATQAGARSERLDRWLPVVAFCLSLPAAGLILPSLGSVPRAVLGGAVALLALLSIGERRRFTLLIGFTMLAFGGWNALLLSVAGHARTRSYFGVYTVAENSANHTRLMIHGTTLHGLQRLTPGHERDPLGYYAPRSGAGLAMRAAPAVWGARARIGVVGLGAGVLACYHQPGQDWHFYEIDPTDVALARTRFSFLARCTPHAPVIVGDARLMLERERGLARFDLLAIDAFSSDSVPMHLLTREALDAYAARLSPHGALVFNITNRAIDLEPVLAAAAARKGWVGALRVYTPDAAALATGELRSVWVLLSPDRATAAHLTAGGGWRPLRARPGFSGWSDDFASILPLIRPGGAR